MTNDRIVDRIRKLLALGQSSNQHEAELAIQRANDLLEKHQLSMTDIEIKAVADEGGVQERYTVGGLKMKLIWVYDLARGCAMLFDGECVPDRRLWGTKFTFVGTRPDVAMAIALFEHLYSSWAGIVKADLKEAKFQSDRRFEPRDTMGFKQGHGVEYAQTIAARCRKLANQRKIKLEANSSTGTALVVTSKKAIVASIFTDMGIRYKTKLDTQSKGNSDGRSYGRAAGNAAQLTKDLT
ncbi:hypothetical protein LCGC14_0789770 [marine sediment metagenome]|uniref:Uncharacterized protein n=1 Tax=marine sediment metagenome TaxID=412755 RepID=A0A0F9SCY6_9ZZZZ